MDFQQLLDNITPEIYRNLKQAVELGKWPDGKCLEPEQRDLCMQAVIAYENKHFEPEHRTGYIPPKPGPACGSKEDAEPAEQPLNWKQ